MKQTLFINQKHLTYYTQHLFIDLTRTNTLTSYSFSKLEHDNLKLNEILKKQGQINNIENHIYDIETLNNLQKLTAQFTTDFCLHIPTRLDMVSNPA